MAYLKNVVVMVLLSAGAGLCQDFPETVDRINLTRNFAIELAIRKNTDLRTEALNIAMAQKDLARSRSIYDTVLSASSNGGISYVPGDPFFLTKNSTSLISLTQNLPIGGSISATTQTGFTSAETEFSGSTSDWQSSVGLSLSQPLLRNAGKQFYEFGITTAGISFQDTLERFRAANAETVLSVISSYNRLYTLRQVLEARQSAFNSAQSFLEEIKARTTKVQAMEVANAEYAIAQRRRDLVEAERNVRDQEATLRYLIGLEARIQLVPIEPPSRDEPPESEVQAIKLAMEFRPELRQLRLTLQTTELQEQIARHQTLPDLSLTASGGFSGTGPDFGSSFRKVGNHPSRFWSAGMQFSIPLGNTAAENEYSRSRIRTEQVKKQIEGIQWRIRNEVESDMRALISARLQMHMAEKSRQLAEQRLEEYRKNNKAGTATVQDVLNAENDLTSAKNSQMDAEETFAYAVSRLYRDIGVLLERQGVRITDLVSAQTGTPGPALK